MSRLFRTVIKLLALAATLLLHVPLTGWALATVSRRRRPRGDRLLLVAPFPPGDESGGARAVKDFIAMLQRRYEPAIFVASRDARPSRWQRFVGQALLRPLRLPVQCESLSAGDRAIQAAFSTADVAILEFFSTALPFYLGRPDTPLVILRDHEVLVRKLAMERDAARGLERLVEALRLAVCYLVSRAIYARVDRIVTLTEEDRQGLLTWFPGLAARTVAIPVAFEPASSPVRATPSAPVRDLLMIGNFFHRPNVDALVWFLRDCAPHLPAGFTLHVCGFDKPLDAVPLPAGPVRVVRHGFVDDPLTAAGSAAIAVAPVVSGGGVRMKNLFLASIGIAIVTTPLGNEGIGFVDGRDALVAETGAVMAARLLALADDPAAVAALGRHAQDFVRAHFSPDAVLDLVSREVER